MGYKVCRTVASFPVNFVVTNTMLCLMLLLAAFHLNSALKASCSMKVDGDGADIGRATLSSEGSSQSVRVNLNADPSIIKEGYYKLKIHEGSCGGDVSNDDFMSLEAGERGEKSSIVKKLKLRKGERKIERVRRRSAQRRKQRKGSARSKSPKCPIRSLKLDHPSKLSNITPTVMCQ